MFFNIGTGERHTLNELIALLGNMLGHELHPVHRAPRTGDVRHSLADIGKARQLLDYEPRVNFEEGLRRTLAWFQENR